MLKKEVKFGTEVSKNLLKGIEILHDAVVTTMGVSGKNVMFNNDEGYVRITKDGVTVAKNINNLENTIQDFGARVVKHSAIRTSETAGDGTTTATLLSYQLIKEAFALIDKGANVVQVQKGIEKASKLVLNQLKSFKKEIDSTNSDEILTKVATLSSNGDTEVSKMIVEAINKVGRTGIVTVTPSKYENVRMEEVNGLKFNRGYLSENFINNGEKLTSDLNRPYIVITDIEVSNAQSVANVLNHCYNEGRDVLFIAKAFSGGALATLIGSSAQGIVRICAVETPSFDAKTKDVLYDLCAITGATLVSSDTGKDMLGFDVNWFGESESVSVTKSTTTIVGGNGEESAITQRVNIIRKEMELSQSMYEKEKSYDRLSKLLGGICTILVGGATKIESEERFDRAEDALKATYCALDEGILMGGGVALLRTQSMVDFNDSTIFENKHQLLGANIVKNILTKPFEQILRNAGYEESDIYRKIAQIESQSDEWMVFDPLNDKIVEAYEAGIIDPFKVTRTALQNAVSVCGTIITTDCVIEEIYDKQPSGLGDMLAKLNQ